MSAARAPGSHENIGRTRPRRAARSLVLPIDHLHPVILLAHQRAFDYAVRMPPRRVSSHVFILMLEGRGSFQLRSRTYPLGKNQLYFMEPMQPHAVENAPGGTQFIAVLFDPAPGYPPSSDRRKDDRPPRNIRLSHGLQIPERTVLPENHPAIGWFKELVKAFRSDRPTGRLEASVYLQRVMLSLLRPASDAGLGARINARARAKIERVLRHVEANLARPLTVGDLARVADLSVTHLNRLMAECTGKSPADYIRDVRVRRARELLTNVDLTIKEVAVQCGFRSPYHFSKVFRDADGLSPTQFRQSFLAE